MNQERDNRAGEEGTAEIWLGKWNSGTNSMSVTVIAETSSKDAQNDPRSLMFMLSPHLNGGWT